MLLFLLLAIAYLLGSVSSAILLCRLLGLPDPRTAGSGNPGATNVLRLAGKKLGILVLLGDALKGALAVVLAKYLGLSPQWLGWVALAAFIGHLFPVFFAFRGGKGVATALGGLLALAWPLGLALLATWLMAAAIWRYSSLAAVITTIAAPVYGYWLVGAGSYFPLIIMSALLLARHQQNIRRLLTGKETRLGKKTAKKP
jgi:glycerol-3-phosphate acyltransferase PlsY